MGGQRAPLPGMARGASPDPHTEGCPCSPEGTKEEGVIHHHQGGSVLFILLRRKFEDSRDCASILLGVSGGARKPSSDEEEEGWAALQQHQQLQQHHDISIIIRVAHTLPVVVESGVSVCVETGHNGEVVGELAPD